MADYHRALAVDPKYAYTYAGLAWLQATCPNDKFRDGKEALENAHKASQLNGSKDWRLIGILAAAYAESGDFDKAKEWEAKAIELAATDKSATAVRDRERFRSSLELYKQGKPYREEAKKK